MSNPRIVVLVSSLFFLVSLQAAAESIEVRGMVRGPEGDPVVDAAVELQPFLDHYERKRLLLEQRSEPAPIASTRTQATGRFALTAPVGVFQVVVRASGYVAMRRVPVVVTRTIELPAVALPADVGAPIEFSLSDDRPVAGAAVYALPSEVEATVAIWRPWRRSGWEAATRIAWTGDDGKASLPRLDGEWLDLSLFPAGSATPFRVRDVEGVRLLLEPSPEGRRPIRVVNDVSHPVEGVLVAVGQPAWPVGLTDADGRLEISDPFGHDDLEVTLLTADGQRASGEVGRPKPDAPAKTFVVPAPRLVAGGLVIARTQRPVANGLVWPGHDPGRFVRSSDDGSFDLVVPPTERLWLQAEADGFLSKGQWIDGSEAGAAAKDLRLALSPAAAIEGTVTDLQGQPLAGVEVAVQREGASSSATFSLDPSAGRAVSDERGRFTLTPLAAGASYELTATHRRFITTSVTLGGLELGRPRQVRLELPPSRGGFGRVVDLEDRPITDAVVALRRAVEKSGRQRLRGLELADDAAPSPFRVRTDAEGRFDFAELPAREIDLLARGPGFAPMVIWGVEIVAGEAAVDLGTLVLEPASAVEGVALNGAAEPLEGISVWAFEGGARSRDLAVERLAQMDADAVSAVDGRFTLEDLQPGVRVDLVAFGPGFAPAVVRQVTAPNDPLAKIVLDAAAQLTGRVVDSQGLPIPAARIDLRAQDLPVGVADVRRVAVEDERVTFSDEAGRFAVQAIRPGAYEVVAEAEGFQAEPAQRLELAAGVAPDEVLITLERGATLVGRTLDAAGEPVAGVQVMIGASAARSDASGAYEARGVALGRQMVEALHAEHNRLVEAIEIEAGRNELDLTFDPTRQVSGRVVDESGRRIADARLHLRSQAWRNSRHYRALTSDDGRFVFPRVATGEYELAAEKGGYVTTEVDAPVVVADDDVGGLQVRLDPGSVVRGRILGLDFNQLATVQVVAEGDAGRRLPGRVDFEGRYEIHDLAPGDWLLQAALQDGGRQTRAWVTIAPGDRKAQRDLEFEPGLALSGEVLYNFEPLAGAALTLVGRDVAVERQVLTDYLGRFELEDLRPGSYRLTVSSARELLVHNEDLDLRSDRDVVVEIATASVSGSVTADGAPLADALVALRQIQGEEASSLFTVGTDTEGAFTLARLSGGRYRVTVRKDGYAMAEDLLDISAGTERSDLHYDLSSTEGLDLVVRLASGEVPLYASVAITDGGGRTVLAESRNLEADGSVRFPTVPPGRWDVLVSAPGAATRRLSAELPGEPIELTLNPAARLRVRVPALMEPHLRATLTLDDANGQPLESLDPMTSVPATLWPVTGGIALVDGVPPGAWTARVESTDGQSWIGQVAVVGSGEATATLE
ncbi:MAG: carboxypeptidase-like regulatory domain-containing protein [Acidobacteriota bacterium]